MNNDLLETLSLMAKGRENLVEKFTEKNSDIYRYSFQYHSSPVALDIAACLVTHTWLDELLADAQEKYDNKVITQRCINNLIQTLQKSSIFRSEGIMFEGYDNLLKTKVECLRILLTNNDNMSKKLRALEFNIFRDRVLFERELSKYS